MLYVRNINSIIHASGEHYTLISFVIYKLYFYTKVIYVVLFNILLQDLKCESIYDCIACEKIFDSEAVRKLFYTMPIFIFLTFKKLLILLSLLFLPYFE